MKLPWFETTDDQSHILFFAVVMVTPKLLYEGADCPIEPSERDSVHHRVHQLRDPCIFEDLGETYLLYSVAGECGIAIGELTKN